MSIEDEPTDDELRAIARKGSTGGIYSGGVKALRAVWEAASQRGASDAEVEAVARVFYASQTGADMLATSGYRDKWMGIARAALIAALSARNTRETQ